MPRLFVLSVGLAMPGSTDLLRALRLIVSLRSDRAEWIEVNPKLDIAFLPRSWHQHISDPDEPAILNRRILEVAVFLELAEAVQAGEIYVPGSRNYDTNTDRLYPIEPDPQAVSAYLKARGLPDNAKAFFTQLREWLGRHRCRSTPPARTTARR